MRTPSTQQLAIAIPVLLVVSTVFVAGGGIGLVEYHLQPPSDERAVELLRESAATAATVEAYRYEVRGTAEGTYGDERQSISIDGHGAVNRTTRRIHVEASAGDTHEELYVEGYTRYERCPLSRFVNVENAWYGVALDGTAPWSSYTTLGELDTLERISHVYLDGHETIDGTRTRVVVVRPDPTRLDELRPRVRPDRSDRDGWLRKITVRTWISNDTGRPIRIRIRRVSRTGPLFGARVVENLVYTYDYGPTTVPLPNETVETEASCPEP